MLDAKDSTSYALGPNYFRFCLDFALWRSD